MRPTGGVRGPALWKPAGPGRQLSFDCSLQLVIGFFIWTDEEVGMQTMCHRRRGRADAEIIRTLTITSPERQRGALRPSLALRTGVEKTKCLLRHQLYRLRLDVVGGTRAGVLAPAAGQPA